jgi:hypothetical protein
MKINPNFGTINAQVWAGNSFFAGLELQLTWRMTRGLQIQGSYPWGMGIDTSSATNGVGSLHRFKWKMSRGVRPGHRSRVQAC